jgi:hypothetical protein
MPMLNRQPPNPRRGLFDPPPSTPTWEMLLETVRREAVEILVRMIRDLLDAPNGAAAAREVADE